MCANYDASKAEQLVLDFGALAATFEYRSEIYPGYDAPVLVAEGDALVPVRATFGLIPHWAKDTKISRMTYNARSETISKLPSYRHAWKLRQFCLVPVASFYEPSYETGKPVRWSIRRVDTQPFALAAIWDRWKNPEGLWQRSFSLITVNATDHPLMKRFHAPEDEKRSVVVVPAARNASWLGTTDEEDAREHLNLFDAAAFTAIAAPRPPRKASAKPES